MISLRPWIAPQAVQRRVAELAREVRGAVGDPPWVCVQVLEGARRFAADLWRHGRMRLPLHSIVASSYGSGTESSGTVQTGGEDRLPPLRDQRVLLIEDIVDTGRTVARLEKLLRARGAREVRVLALLEKPARRVEPVHPWRVGFSIPDRFVVGYGLDHDGRHRELDGIAVLEE